MIVRTTEELVTIVIALEVTVDGFVHGSLLIKTTVIMSPLLSVELVKVDAVCPPAFTPFIIH